MTEQYNQDKEQEKMLDSQKYSLSLNSQIENLDKEFGKLENLTKNPFAMASLIIGLKDAFEKFNLLLKDLNQSLVELRTRIERLESAKESRITPSLSHVDQAIYDFVMTHEKVCAEDVQKEFNYKGKHAASARLNKLFGMALLNKTQSGRTIHYMLKG